MQLPLHSPSPLQHSTSNSTHQLTSPLDEEEYAYMNGSLAHITSTHKPLDDESIYTKPLGPPIVSVYTKPTPPRTRADTPGYSIPSHNMECPTSHNPAYGTT